MTTEEKAALVEYAKKKIESLRFCLKQTAFESVRGHLEPELMMAEIALDALTTDPVAAPKGWKLVPVEPTQEMVDAHMNGVASGGFQCGYRAMIAASPTP